MNNKTEAKARLLAMMFFLGFAHIGAAKAENWQTIGSDQDAFGNDMRTIEVDLDSVKSTATERTVKARISTHSISKVGYNCSEGELRHGNVDKTTKMICKQPSSPNPYGDHQADWQTISVDKANGSITKFDRNSLSRSGDLVSVTEDTAGIGKTLLHFDCRGYYRIGNGQWVTLDLTDRIPTVPRGFVSLERKASNKVCPSKTAAESKPAATTSYDPIPRPFDLKIGLPGLLSVGTSYCTESGECAIVEKDIKGCGFNEDTKDSETCLSGRMAVDILAVSRAYCEMGSVIVHLNGKNYSVDARGNWYKKKPDGTFVGGPVSVIYQGEVIPLTQYCRMLPR